MADEDRYRDEFGMIAQLSMEGSEKAISKLIQEYLGNPAEPVRVRAREALVDVGSTIIPGLRDSLFAKNVAYPIKEEIAAAMLQIGGEEAFSALESAKNDREITTWHAACLAFETDIEVSHPALQISNWHPGDPHVHSDYSRLDISELPGVRHLPSQRMKNIEGRHPVEDIAEVAVNKAGLSWVVFTEHGPDLGLKEGIKGMNSDCDFKLAVERWAAETERLDKVENEIGRGCFLIGEELGTWGGAGHLLVYGSNHYVPNSWKDANEDMFLDVADKSGGFSFIAHPYLNKKTPIPGKKVLSYWWHKFPQHLYGIKDSTSLRGFELLHGKYRNPEKEEGISDLDRLKLWEERQGIASLLDDWEKTLSSGLPVGIIGGSDAHRLKHVGQIRTYAYFPNNSKSIDAAGKHGLLEAIREGRTIVSTGPIIVFIVKNETTGSTVTVGERLEVYPGDELTIEFRHQGFSEKDSKEIRLICPLCSSEGEILTQDTATLEVPYHFPKSDKGKSYLRIEVVSKEHRCYTNPVFIDLKD